MYCICITNVAIVASSTRKISVAAYVRVLTSGLQLQNGVGVGIENFFKINVEICTVGTLCHARNSPSVSVACTDWNMGKYISGGGGYSNIYFFIGFVQISWMARQASGGLHSLPQILCGVANSPSCLWLLCMYSDKHGAKICRVLRSHLSSL